MRSIITHILPQIEETLLKAPCEVYGLLGGKIGIAYYLYHSYVLNGSERVKAQATKLIEEVSASLPTLLADRNFSYAEGLAGISYVLNELQQSSFGSPNIGAQLGELDKPLFEVALDMLETGNVEFLYGASGILHYLLNRRNRPEVENYLHILINKLVQLSVKDPVLSESYPSIASNKGSQYLDLSLSHGLTGVLLVLLRIQELGIKGAALQPLTEGGIHLMMHYRGQLNSPENPYAIFPFFIDKHTSQTYFGNKLGWSYGDLNQALLLYKAAQIFQHDGYKKMGDLIGTHTLIRRDQHSTGVQDMYFCNGTVGLAHFYKVLFQYSGIESYYDGYHFWIEQSIIYLMDTLEIQRLGSGLIDGLTGTAFTLLSYLYPKQLDWSKTLLLC